MPDPDPRNDDELSEEARLALIHTPTRLRDPLATFFRLDRRLARIVSATSEMMLGQLRLAWWREALGRSPEERPRGDLVLDGVGEHLLGREAALGRLVDGWEQLLKDGPLAAEDARAFAEGRGAALTAVYDEATQLDAQSNAFMAAARCWALADLAANVSNEAERDMLIMLGLEAGAERIVLTREARGLAVLGALGHRALKRGARPLMNGRGAALTAMRASLLGR